MRPCSHTLSLFTLPNAAQAADSFYVLRDIYKTSYLVITVPEDDGFNVSRNIGTA